MKKSLLNPGLPVIREKASSTCYQIITIDQKMEWDTYVSAAIAHDFYHTWYYHLGKDGEPVLFVFEQGNHFIALPFFKRETSRLLAYDCTSAYGYPGPITNLPAEMLDAFTILKFKDSLIDYLNSVNIISAFFRFHPIINQNSAWNSLDGFHTHGRTVTVDLAQSLEDQRQQYHRTTRSRIRQLNKKGFNIKIADSESDISEFVRIYQENMKRVQASACYFFDESYFKLLMSAPDFKCKLFLCFDKKKVTSGAIITFTNNIMQLHLSGTSAEYLKEAPMKLLIDEITLYGRAQGMQYLHMGGGVGGNEDSLFRFKAGFSDTMFCFNTWRLISNPVLYDELVQEAKNAHPLQSDFFPLYRGCREA